MATLEFITKEDLELFKKELFSELRRPGQKLHKQNEQSEWLKSYEVRKLLSISPGIKNRFPYLLKNLSFLTKMVAKQ